VREVTGRLVVGAAIVAGIQLAAALAVVVLWHYTKDSWAEAAYLLYYLAFLLLLPVLAFTVGRRLTHMQGVSVLLAWPLVLANLVAAGGAHGFEDAGVGVTGMLVAFTGLSFLAGWVALRQGTTQGTSGAP
jgi:hypothetical protein